MTATYVLWFSMKSFFVFFEEISKNYLFLHFPLFGDSLRPNCTKEDPCGGQHVLHSLVYPPGMLLLKGGMTQLVACFLPRPGQNMPPGGMFLRSSNRAKTTFLNRCHHITIPSSPTENRFWPPSQKPQGWSFLVHFWPKIKQKNRSYNFYPSAKSRTELKLS